MTILTTMILVRLLVPNAISGYHADKLMASFSSFLRLAWVDLRYLR